MAMTSEGGLFESPSPTTKVPRTPRSIPRLIRVPKSPNELTVRDLRRPKSEPGVEFDSSRDFTEEVPSRSASVLDDSSITFEALEFDSHKRNNHESASGVHSRCAEKENMTYYKPYEQDCGRMIELISSNDSGSKRDGLVSFHAYLQGAGSMSSEEAKKMKETLNRYFNDPNAKMFNLFLDVLGDFIAQYKDDLVDWLFVLLTRLLQRLAGDLLPSSKTKIAKVLDIARKTYPLDKQFMVVIKYFTNNTQTPSLSMKAATLQYLCSVIVLMDPNDFTNTDAIRLALSKIIMWTTEPKSSSVRKESASVTVALFELNPAEFSMMLATLPTALQEIATKSIQTHVKHTTANNIDENNNCRSSSRGSRSGSSTSSINDNNNNNNNNMQNNNDHNGNDYNHLSLENDVFHDERSPRSASVGESYKVHSKIPVRSRLSSS